MHSPREMAMIKTIDASNESPCYSFYAKRQTLRQIFTILIVELDNCKKKKTFVVNT